MEKYDLSNLDVLIVDHNQHMMGIIRTVLTELGVRRVRETTSPDIAYEMFREHAPDIVFSDWVPGSGEMVFLNNVRTSEDSPNPFVPIIVVTSYSEQSNVIAARDLGMTEFIATPVSAKTIYSHLCRVINDKRSFIREPHYFGPDRRRHDEPDFTGNERRSDSQPVAKKAPDSDEDPDIPTKIIAETAS